MGLFDKMKQAAANVSGNQTVTFTFQALPESLAQMLELPEASLDTPFKAAALTVCALCAYGADRAIGQEMLNWLRGPRPLNGQDISFKNDRFRDGKSYIVMGDDGGTLRLMDGFSGSTISALSLGSAIQASPAAYGNQIVVGTTGGMLYFVELR